MRHNYTVKRSTLEDHYDMEYGFFPDQPHTSRFINHRRKLITVNLAADPFNSWPEEIRHEVLSVYMD